MKIGKVTGRVVSTQKLEALEGLKLVLLQPLDENLQNTGDPIVAVDTNQAGIGSIVYYEVSREASRVVEARQNPCDAAVMGIIDDIQVKNRK
jgi:ethanolamine utilization protein EutN